MTGGGVSRAVLLALAAGMVGVAAAWELIVAVSSGGGARWATRVLGPLRRAGTRGVQPTLAERRRLAALAAVSCLAAGWLIAGPTAALVLAAAGPPAIAAVVRARRRRWRARLGDQAPAISRAIGDALAGGHSVRGALVVVAADGGIPPPAAGELRDAAAALQLGEATAAVLERLRGRAATPAYDTLTAAILIQQQAGGDLARLLRDLATSLESAVRAARDARAATAQARFTGTLVAALPAGAAALAELAQPGTLTGLLATPLTATMVITALVLQAAGLILIRRLAAQGPA
jgi:tight adherence protein B